MFITSDVLKYHENDSVASLPPAVHFWESHKSQFLNDRYGVRFFLD